MNELRCMRCGFPRQFDCDVCVSCGEVPRVHPVDAASEVCELQRMWERAIKIVPRTVADRSTT